ncbi:zinc-binding dehydrogenase [Xylogone sp. PMI_703]|nr:zinc-binding dehydrogenase [Xylogone sp. PMI_703]
MSSKVQNRAAWLVGKGQKLEVNSAPYTAPSPNHLVIRNHAVAINPIDWMLQGMGTMIFNWVKYPHIMGWDVAGEVVEVGKDVTRYRIGDRIIGTPLGTTNGKVSLPEAGFQEYVVLREDMCAPIPERYTYEQACVVPLGCSTAACGLYQKDYLNLRHPSLNAKASGQTVLIWAGSTSVGSNAIQLAKSSGYEVVTTCSPKNFEYVKRLGASEAFDYRSKTVAEDIIKALEEKDCVGALCMSPTAIPTCMDILSKLRKARKFIATVSLPGQPENLPRGIFGLISMIGKMIGANIQVFLKSQIHGVSRNHIFGSDLAKNEVGPAVWKDFLGDALANGSFVPSPEPIVIPEKGLEGIQTGIELHQKGVSAKKVVVSLL